MKLSIVTTLYRSAATLDEFCRRVLAVAGRVADDVELVIVNDGSPDDSLARTFALQQADARIVIVDLARNFGHHKAMMTGLTHARGDMVFLIDSDLEEEPELLLRFHQRFAQGDCDVVYGVQEQRRGSFVDRTVGELFFWLMARLSDQPFPRNVVTARLMTREYVRALVRHRDREFLIGHLWHTTGFKQVALPIAKLTRSPTTYPLRKRIEMGVRHVTTSSTKLLYIILYAGVAISSLSLIAILFYVARYLTSGIGVDGFTSLIVSIWFFGGLTTFILGVLGVYVANILSETKRRPYTIVRAVHRAEAQASTASNVARIHPSGQRADTGTRS